MAEILKEGMLAEVIVLDSVKGIKSLDEDVKLSFYKKQFLKIQI